MEARYTVLPVDQVRESPDNPRKHFDEKKLAELTSSIRQKGVLVPLIARPVNGHFELAAGHRRLRAAVAAGLPEVPVIVREMDDETFLEVLTIENLQREDVHPLEEAEGFERLLKLKGYTVELLAEKIGRDESYVYKRLQLAKLIEPAKVAFRENRIQIGHAIRLARLEERDQKHAFDNMFREETEWDPEARESVTLGQICISPSELEILIQSEVYLDLARASFAKDNAKLLPAAGACTTCTKRTGANLALFDDTKKGDHCLDRACFHKKQNAQLAQITKAAAKAGRKLVKLTRSYGTKDAIYEAHVNKLKPADLCGSEEEAIYIDGPLVGKTVFICQSKTCKKHAGSGRGLGYSQPERTFAEVWAAKKQRLDERIKLESQREIWRQIVGEVPEEFNRPEMVLVGYWMIKSAGHDNCRNLCGALGLSGEKGRHSTDFYAPLVAHLEALEERHIPGFLVGLTLAAWGGFNEERLKAFASLYEIDMAAITKATADPLRAEFAKKKERAHAAQKKKEAAAKQAAGAKTKGRKKAKPPAVDVKKRQAGDRDDD